MKPLLVTAVLLIGILHTAAAVKCYECNVWKAGYGHMCNNPRIREDCTVCMKIETSVKTGYYKNKPRESIIISRVCAYSKTMHFSHECHPYTAVAGSSVRCYCDSDLCNSSPRGATPTLTTMATLTAVGLLFQRLYFKFWDVLS